MTTVLSLHHERLDDIPVLIAFQQQLTVPAILDRHLGNHGLQQGLTNGTLAIVWLSYILSEGDHRKATVRDWVDRRRQTLTRLLRTPIRSVDFTDDRLSNLLRRFSDDTAWDGIERDLWGASVAVYAIAVTAVRLDSTTAAGYHQVTEDGLMQYGHSKDHRPDLAQLKLMAAAAEPSGQLLATMIHPGNAADDPLYCPLLARVRPLVDRPGMLYVGDSKMAALATRADIVAHADYYLVPLPRNGQSAAEQEDWITAGVDGTQPQLEVWDGERQLGGGYECTRPVEAAQPETEESLRWTERVLVFRSLSQAAKESEHLLARLASAEAAVSALTPPPKQGRRQYREEDALAAAVAAVLLRYHVTGLLQASWQQEETVSAGRKRGRYVITGVQRDADAVAAAVKRLGWRLYGTNLPGSMLPFDQTIVTYRGGWRLEHDYHLLKDKPLGISPFFVQRDDQIRGLTRLLTLGVRLLTLLQSQVRHGLAQARETLPNLYEASPTRTTDQPTARRILKAFARAELTLTRVILPNGDQWHVTPLPASLRRVLEHLHLPPTLYARLAANTS